MAHFFLVDPVGFLHWSFSGPGSDAAPGPQVAVPRQLDCWGSCIVGCGDLENVGEITMKSEDLTCINLILFHLNNQFHFGVLIFLGVEIQINPIPINSILLVFAIIL